MELIVCNRCGCEIKRGVILNPHPASTAKIHPPYSKIQLRVFTGEGRLTTESGDIHLCEKCTNLLKEFIDYHSSSAETEGAEVANFKKEAEMINCYDSTPAPNAIEVGKGLMGIKSVMKCGNVYLYIAKTFNDFQKKMWKRVFGVEIYEIEADSDASCFTSEDN